MLYSIILVGSVFEPELLKQVEVEVGAGSAAAGPGALGGSVRFTTKDPEDLLKPGEQAGALLKSGYYSNGDSVKNSATVFGSTELSSNGQRALSGLISIVDANFNNLEDGNGDEIPGTESERRLGYAKVVSDITDTQTLALSYESLREEGDILYRPELIESARNAVEPTSGERDTYILNYGLDTASDAVDFSVNLYQTKLRQDREFRGINYFGSVETVGTTIQNKSRIDDHQLIYGINYREDKSKLHDISTDPFDFDETGNVKGVYIQDIVQVSKALTVTAGIRYDDYYLKDVNDQTIEDDGYSPNLSANYELTPELSISAGYAEALRGAEIKDSFKLSSSSNEADLKAEKAKNLELGADFNRGGFKAAVGLYQATIENPIGGALPWSRVYENLDDNIETRGYFATVGYAADGLLLNAGFNSARSELDGDTVTRYQYSSSGISIGDTLVLEASYEFTPFLSAGWNAEFVSDINNIDLELAGEDISADKPGYAVHDIYAQWQPMKNDLLTLALTVKNLFNKQYLSHASVEDFTGNPGYESIAGSPEAGRDIRFTASVRF